VSHPGNDGPGGCLVVAIILVIIFGAAFLYVLQPWEVR
jgi:hypothetical protein